MLWILFILEINFLIINIIVVLFLLRDTILNLLIINTIIILLIFRMSIILALKVLVIKILFFNVFSFRWDLCWFSFFFRYTCMYNLKRKIEYFWLSTVCTNHTQNFVSLWILILRWHYQILIIYEFLVFIILCFFLLLII